MYLNYGLSASRPRPSTFMLFRGRKRASFQGRLAGSMLEGDEQLPHCNLTQNSLSKDFQRQKLHSYSREVFAEGLPPPRIRNAGSEKVETKVIKPTTTQRRNHVGRYYPRKYKQQFAENPTLRVSRNGTEIPRKKSKEELRTETRPNPAVRNRCAVKRRNRPE